MTTIDYLDKILYYLHCEVPHKKSLSEILKVVFQDNPQIPLTQLVVHLLEEKFLFQELDAYRSSASQALYGITIPARNLYFEKSRLNPKKTVRLKNYLLINEYILLDLVNSNSVRPIYTTFEVELLKGLLNKTGVVYKVEL